MEGRVAERGNMSSLTLPPDVAASLAALEKLESAGGFGGGGSVPRVCRERGSRAGPGTLDASALRQMEAMEARLMEMIAAAQRQFSDGLLEADRIAELAAKKVDARLNSVERRTQMLDQRVEELNKVAEAAAAQATAVEARLVQAEASRGSATARTPQSPRGSGSCGRNAPEALRREMLMLSAEAEALLQDGLRELHSRCDALQDALDDRATFPLRDLQRRLAEQELKVEELVSANEEHVSRLEEHSVRLGIARAKLESHDEKLALLDRWAGRGGNSGAGSGGRTSPTSGKSWTMSSAEADFKIESCPGLGLSDATSCLGLARSHHDAGSLGLLGGANAPGQ